MELLLWRDHGPPAALRAQAVYLHRCFQALHRVRFVDIMVIDKIANRFAVAAGRRIVAFALNLALVLRLIVGRARSNAESKTWLPARVATVGLPEYRLRLAGTSTALGVGRRCHA